MRIALSCVLLSTLTACATPVSVTPKDAIATACDITQHLATVVSNDIFDNDLRFFLPLWWTKADATADARYCASIIEELSAGTMDGMAWQEQGLDPVHSAAALCGDAVMVVFEARNDRRVGPMGVMGASWAIHDAVLERHGITAKPHSVLPCVSSYYDDARAELRLVGGV